MTAPSTRVTDQNAQREHHLMTQAGRDDKLGADARRALHQPRRHPEPDRIGQSTLVGSVLSSLYSCLSCRLGPFARAFSFPAAQMLDITEMKRLQAAELEHLVLKKTLAEVSAHAVARMCCRISIHIITSSLV